MIHDIAPHIYQNAWSPRQAGPNSTVLLFQKGRFLCSQKNGLHYPTFRQLGLDPAESEYLFSIDQQEYYRPLQQPAVIPEEYSFEPQVLLRTAEPRFEAFAGFVGGQLDGWYRDNRFCGRCGTPLKPDQKERMLRCPNCQNMVYPKICPGIIVAVIHQDKLLLTKYANRPYANWALIAGFTEIGEPIEDTVRREVMEEVGLKVKDITFYRSQPWAFSSSLLCGFFAHLDGSDEITLQQDELAQACWMSADEIDLEPDKMSLTREMIMLFKAGRR
ncbi:MAG: NAD(+) diphosphatase [Pygmaiobacter massiliensis]|nr:NAD(+) diphosphatase [Pygmaiobacter massiliensis]